MRQLTGRNATTPERRPVSDHPGEYGFIIIAQVSELYWMLIIAWMTPNDLLAILSRVGETHGKDTALQDWTYRHMVYLLGTRPAYFGTEGIAWLKPTLDELPFPELWPARSVIGEPPPGCPHHARG